MSQSWYIVQTLSGKEQQVKDSLERRVALDSLEDSITEMLIPCERVSEVKGGRKIISQRKFWPGYLFIKMGYSEKAFYAVTETPGVIGFVGGGNPPPTVQDEEMAEVLGQIEEKREKVKPKVLFEIGEAVKVNDGPFTNMTGLVDTVDPDKGKIIVRVAIFGRETPVELEYWQVEKS